jgi:hypothetical protein
MSKVTCANVNGLLHVVVIANGRAWHSIRGQNNWQNFFEIPAVFNVTGEPVEAISDASCAGIDGDLHVFALRQEENGKLPIHNIRFEQQGQWQGWAYVPIPVGNPLPDLLAGD